MARNESLASSSGTANTTDVDVIASALPDGAATSAKQNSLLTELQLKADLTETQPVSAATLPLPSGAATSANQTNGTQLAKIKARWGSGAAETDELRMDGSTNALNVIEYEHHEIHAGSSFWYDDVVTGSAAVNYVLTTPNSTDEVHFGYDIDSSNAGYTLEIFEAGDRVPTTAQTAYNRNREIGTAPTATIHKAFTDGATDGTRIVWHVSGTTAAGGKVGGSTADGTERVLAINTQYIIRITPLASNTFSLRINWYEHTPKH